jgi:hypothetical protein
MLVSPRVFVNFATRLDPASDERRRRLSKAHCLSAPRLLEVVLADYESRYIAKLNELSAPPTSGGISTYHDLLRDTRPFQQPERRAGKEKAGGAWACSRRQKET